MTATRIRRREAVATGDWPSQVLPLLRRVYAGRGIVEAGGAQPRLAQLLPPDALGGLDAACRLLRAAIDERRHIVVVGDFDCDGATACALMVRGLRALGAERVTATVPNRMAHGYGLSPSLVDELVALSPELLVTVDHGIACHAGIARACENGWQVLVTDHHLPGEALPVADAIVNPNLREDGFPSKALAGVGVAFYVLLALRRVLRDAGRWPRGGEPDLTTLLDLVAVGTVADLVPLDANNRALVGAGLRRLRGGQGSAGLQALIEVAGRDARHLTASDIGFAIAPRLNAAGRLEDMSLGIECLLCDDPAQAREMAVTLNEINAERRGVQQQMVDEAQVALAKLAALETEPPLALCLFDAEWHPGVVGLVASRIKEGLHRPVIAFAPAEPGAESLRGSARSIPGFHMRDALAAVDAAHPGLIEKFGGHAMAAGLSLAQSRLPAFEAAFREVAARWLDDSLLQAEWLSDGELLPEEFDRVHAEALRDGGPWGQGFPEPLFDGEFEVIDWRVVGTKHLKFSLRLPGRAQPLGAIQFGGWREQAKPKRVHAVYQLDTDDYQDRRGIQLLIRHWVALP
ncbi:single-stranded-DNA-specific exonuclease RecJ [Pseudoxanthomonas beigongshangi]